MKHNECHRENVNAIDQEWLLRHAVYLLATLRRLLLRDIIHVARVVA